jgi:hypothetical protein
MQDTKLERPACEALRLNFRPEVGGKIYSVWRMRRQVGAAEF